MDILNEKNHVFNIKLSKLTGLYQILDPGTIRFRGQNVYRIFIAFLMSYSCAIGMTVFVSSLYCWKNNTFLSIWYFWIAPNTLYMCYKMWIVFYRSNDIWNCLSITWYGFTSLSSRNGYNYILDSWRERSVWHTNLLAGAYSLTTIFYVGFLLVFGDTKMPIKNHDGSVSNYRQNVFNLYFFVSDETYNEYYNTFFVVELLLLVALFIFFIFFDILLMTLCFAMSDANNLLESVNHKSFSGPDSSIDHTNEQRNISNEHDLIYDELKTIVINHQAVIKNYELFLTVFERVILLHIFISSISLIIMWFIFIMSFFDGGTFVTSGVMTVKIIVPIPAFSFQIFMMCYLFGNLHNQKDSIIFALYSSNWTEMNMKCKKLILLTMKLNNANQKKLKFTRTKLVNLEMFFKTMRYCYTILSVLINYIKANSD